MTRPRIAPATGRNREGSLDEIGACLFGIFNIASGAGDLEEEQVRAVYLLAAIALDEWRLLDEAAGTAVAGDRR